MNKKLILFLMIIISTVIFSKTRDIFIGDIIKIKISGTLLTESEIAEKFDKFKIEDFQKENDEYIIDLKALEAGNHEMKLGNKDIKILVKSTLDKFDNKDIFIDDENIGEVSNIRKPFPVTVVICFIIISILAVGIVFLIKHLKKVIDNESSAIDEFNKILSSADITKDYYFVTLTYALKKYVYKKFGVKVIGKTSKEILKTFSKIDLLEKFTNDLQIWLEFSDMCKFAGREASKDEKEEKLKELKLIVENIEKIETE